MHEHCLCTATISELRQENSYLKKLLTEYQDTIDALKAELRESSTNKETV